MAHRRTTSATWRSRRTSTAPQYAVIGGDYNLAVSKYSKAKAAAWAWIQWVVAGLGLHRDAGHDLDPSSIRSCPTNLTDFSDAGVELMEINPAPAGEESLLADTAERVEGRPLRPAVPPEARRHRPRRSRRRQGQLLRRAQRAVGRGRHEARGLTERTAGICPSHPQAGLQPERLPSCPRRFSLAGSAERSRSRRAPPPRHRGGAASPRRPHPLALPRRSRGLAAGLHLLARDQPRLLQLHRLGRDRPHEEPRRARELRRGLHRPEDLQRLLRQPLLLPRPRSCRWRSPSTSR